MVIFDKLFPIFLFLFTKNHVSSSTCIIWINIGVKMCNKKTVTTGCGRNLYPAKHLRIRLLISNLSVLSIIFDGVRNHSEVLPYRFSFSGREITLNVTQQTSIRGIYKSYMGEMGSSFLAAWCRSTGLSYLPQGGHVRFQAVELLKSAICDSW